MKTTDTRSWTKITAYYYMYLL